MGTARAQMAPETIGTFTFRPFASARRRHAAQGGVAQWQGACAWRARREGAANNSRLRAPRGAQPLCCFAEHTPRLAPRQGSSVEDLVKAFHEASKQKKARAAGHAAHTAHAASVPHPCLTRFARSAACADHVPQGVLPVAPGSRPRCASRLRVPPSRLRIGDATLGLTLASCAALDAPRRAWRQAHRAGQRQEAVRLRPEGAQRTERMLAAKALNMHPPHRTATQ